jgi:hypothetical protein
MQYRLRTLMIVLALLPPVLAHAWVTRGTTLDAIHRASPEVPFQLLALAVAIFVVTAEFRRRSKTWL